MSTFFRVAIISLAVFLSACTTAPKTDALIPIASPCKVETPAKPDYRYSPPYDSLFDAVRDLLGDRELSIAYETKLEASLKGCK